MRRLIDETRELMERENLFPSNVIFIGSRDGTYSCSWDQYKKLADVAYDSGYGSSQVAEDLIIVFDNGQTFTRNEYDGAEWWEVSPKPPTYDAPNKIERLFAREDQVGWVTLREIHDETTF